MFEVPQFPQDRQLGSWFSQGYELVVGKKLSTAVSQAGASTAVEAAVNLLVKRGMSPEAARAAVIGYQQKGEGLPQPTFWEMEMLGIPAWMWIGGGGALALLFFMRK